LKPDLQNCKRKKKRWSKEEEKDQRICGRTKYQE